MTPAVKAPPGQPPAPSVLREELKRHAPLFRKAFFFSLTTSLLVLAPTIFMLEVYDRVVSSRSDITLVMLLVLVIGAYVVMEMLDNVRHDIMHDAALKAEAALRPRLFEAAFEATLRRGGPGASAQVFGDLRTLRDFLSSQAMMAVMDAPASLVFLIIVFQINPRLGGIALFGAIVQVFIAVRTEKRTMPTLTEANRASGEAQSYASGALRNTQVIEAMGMMGGIQRRWMGKQRKFLQLQADASDHNGMNTATGKFIQTLQGSLILGFSCWLSIEFGVLTGGMMIVASTLGGRVLAPLVQIVAQWRLVVNARDAFTRVDTMLIALPPAEPTMPLPPPQGRLTVEGVVAGAPGSPVPILKGVGFALNPGELLVIIGPSAAGKTTLARLLTGVWPASSGKVRLDGVDVFTWDKDELGPHVGYLPQGVELFDGTFAENIARFGEVDMDKVNAAATMAGLDALIASLPEGLDSRIGDEGAFLSGGQRQRVGLARALYDMPRFLVLDEPNSSLDEAGEAALASALQQLKAAGSTTIVISHRQNILAVADKMLLLRDGQVAMFGPRDEVLAALNKAQAQAQAQAAGAAPGQPMMRPAIPAAVQVRPGGAPPGPGRVGPAAQAGGAA